MKRSIYGALMLLVLLITGIFTTWFMGSCHKGVVDSLEEAAVFAENGNWNRVQEKLQQAKADWDDRWGISAALSDHEPMEKINSLFAQAEVWTKARDDTAFLDVCARLCEALQAIGEAHSVAWWNIA